MGHRTYQRILECAICGGTPDDGEPMWEMGSDFWCEQCCDKDQDEPPELFPGTKAALDRISIKQEQNP